MSDSIVMLRPKNWERFQHYKSFDGLGRIDLIVYPADWVGCLTRNGLDAIFPVEASSSGLAVFAERALERVEPKP